MAGPQLYDLCSKCTKVVEGGIYCAFHQEELSTKLERVEEKLRKWNELITNRHG